MSSKSKQQQQHDHELYEKERAFLRDLLIACEKDDVDTVRELSKKHPICDYRDGKRAGAVHAACRGGSIKTLEFLLTLKPEQAGLKDAEQRTPLMTCCFAHDVNSPACIKLLLGNKYCQESIEHETVNGVRAVHFAASLDTAESLQLLLDVGKCDAAAPSPAGPPLAWAVAHANTADTTKLLLKQSTVDVNAVSDAQEPTPLLLACMQNKVEIARELIAAGAKLDAFTQNLSPMHACCATGAMDCCKLLLEQKPQGQALCLLRDPMDNALPIEVAVHSNQVEIAEFLAPLSGEEFKHKNIREWIKQAAQEEHEQQVANRELAARADAEALAEKDLANAEFAENRFERAAELYLQAIKQHSECTPKVRCILYSNAAQCYLKLHQFENAKLNAEQAINNDKSHVKSYVRLGQACSALKDHESAARAYWTGHEVDKDGPEAGKLLAMFKKEIESAKKEYEKTKQ